MPSGKFAGPTEKPEDLALLGLSTATARSSSRGRLRLILTGLAPEKAAMVSHLKVQCECGRRPRLRLQGISRVSLEGFGINGKEFQLRESEVKCGESKLWSWTLVGG